MSGRPIVLPELPEPKHLPLHYSAEEMADYAADAVEADRRGIVVTDEDVDAALSVIPLREIWPKDIRAALEAYAKRLRGET